MAKLNVKKANYLIPLEDCISKAGQLWISFLIANLPKSREDENNFPTLSFSFREVKRAINADGKRRITESSELKKVHKELMGTPLWHEDEEQGDMVAWLTRVKWDKRSNIFTYYFHPALKPYLLNVKEHYTLYNYYYRVCLSAHAMKFYEILKMYQYLGEVELFVDEDIKRPLGLQGKYKDYYNFRRRVLDSIQAELFDFTDIQFDYEPKQKDGKKVISLLFNIHKNVPKNLPTSLLEAVKEQGLPAGTKTETENDDPEIISKIDPGLYQQLKDWGGQDKNITRLFSENERSKIEYQIAHLKRLMKDGQKINIPFAWLMKAVREDYKDVVKERQQAQKEKQEKRKIAILEEKEKTETRQSLEKSYHDALREQCDYIVSQSPEILKKAVDAAQTLPVIRRKIQEGKSPQDLYTEVFTRGVILSKIQEIYPAHFRKIKEAYQVEIGGIKG